MDNIDKIKMLEDLSFEQGKLGALSCFGIELDFTIFQKIWSSEDYPDQERYFMLFVHFQKKQKLINKELENSSYKPDFWEEIKEYKQIAMENWFDGFIYVFEEYINKQNNISKNSSKTIITSLTSFSTSYNNKVADEMVEKMKDVNFEKLRKQTYQLIPELLATLYRNSKSIKQLSDDKDKISRNSLCPCGSGKKYKKCCGK